MYEKKRYVFGKTGLLKEGFIERRAITKNVAN